MNDILKVDISAVTSLNAELAVAVTREILYAECGYAKLSPASLTLSSRLTVADGGIDAEVSFSSELAVPSDCFFQSGLTGFQIKSGTTFKPWTPSAIRSELLDSNGKLHAEVSRLIERGGRYVLLCTGHDLTPEQRNSARRLIANVFDAAGFSGYEDEIDVLGASQLVAFAERYPGTAAILRTDPIQEAWTLEEWQRDAHMSNQFEASDDQIRVIDQIRSALTGGGKHLRVLGEPGLGKTRLVLEAVKAPEIAPFVLYIQHGTRFAQTKLFRRLLKADWTRPLVLVLDELPESELTDVWRHLKPRCRTLKIVSLDHGRDEAQDEDIERIHAPRLPDEVIKKILTSRVGRSHEIDRWVAICEGSPRVAQAVADNLHSNPNDLLKSPATVPIWDRFLHGYGSRDELGSRQVDCVTQHLALFSRFGYEDPVVDEAKYICSVVQKIDPTIGWARFQEIIQTLRARRVLQGSRTLFFVPKALHIHLWRKFWERYGRGFDFAATFQTMPVSLHAWFLSMFRFAGETATAHVVADILRPDGLFSDRAMLTSASGAKFLSTLAEANSGAVLRLLEATLGTWTNEELYQFKHERQQIVWALEKVAVWPSYTVRALRLLARLAVTENAEYSNNSTGTLIALFRIGPEAAATEAPPEARLPAALELLRAPGDAERRLGLLAVGKALDSHGLGFRTIGPEFQGIRHRAKLWIPETYGDWWKANLVYFQALVAETRDWPQRLHQEVSHALLDAVENQIRTPPCTELAFQVLNMLIEDPEMLPSRLNQFFGHWEQYEVDEQHVVIAKQLRGIARRYAKRNLVSRFQRYVVDVDWQEWDEDFRSRHDKPKNRAVLLVNALARRISENPGTLSEIEALLVTQSSSPALWHFGKQLGICDPERILLPTLARITREAKHETCILGYLLSIRGVDPGFYRAWIRHELENPETAWLGATLALRADYDDELFLLCLEALEREWIDPSQFSALRFGKAIESVPSDRIRRLLKSLNSVGKKGALNLLIELIDSTTNIDPLPFSTDFVFGVVVRTIPGMDRPERTNGYHWKKVCTKLVQWEPSYAAALLDALLTAMGEVHRLSYDSYVAPMADHLVRMDGQGAWDVVRRQLENSLPQWRSDIFGWLKGGLTTFDETHPTGTIIELPVESILSWIDEDIEARAPLIAHAAPRTLDDENGGRLTKELLTRYGRVDGVCSAVGATFHSGGWTGSTSAYLKRRREKFRRWLAAGFQYEVVQWIEKEIEYLDLSIEREEIDEERSRFD